MKDTYLFSYMLNPPYFITRVFKENNKAQENLLNHMCDFEAQEEWRSERRTNSSYLNVDTIKYK